MGICRYHRRAQNRRPQWMRCGIWPSPGLCPQELSRSYVRAACRGNNTWRYASFPRGKCMDSLVKHFSRSASPNPSNAPSPRRYCCRLHSLGPPPWDWSPCAHLRLRHPGSLKTPRMPNQELEAGPWAAEAGKKRLRSATIRLRTPHPLAASPRQAPMQRRAPHAAFPPLFLPHALGRRLAPCQPAKGDMASCVSDGPKSLLNTNE
mmetsp:Transcript_42024/g.116019  ORF Transcript_42024/g.116019 Transcript_42024/m.116019 type:complete len:206 (+) Transcript_42024:1096-1713(+)